MKLIEKFERIERRREQELEKILKIFSHVFDSHFTISVEDRYFIEWIDKKKFFTIQHEAFWRSDYTWRTYRLPVKWIDEYSKEEIKCLANRYTEFSTVKFEC